MQNEVRRSATQKPQREREREEMKETAGDDWKSTGGGGGGQRKTSIPSAVKQRKMEI